MSSEEATSESLCKAFGPKQWSDLRSQADSFLQDLVVTVAPFSGLTSNALAHLRHNWIEWKDEFVIIRVPAEADCNRWQLEPTSNKPGLVERNEPCRYCRGEGTTDGFENLWNGRNWSGKRRYTATLHRDIAEPAVDVLDKVFHIWGRDGINTTPNSVSRAAGQLLPDENRNSYRKILRTGVALYCHYGLCLADIADLTPYTKSTAKNILRGTPEVTRNQNNSYTYLRAVARYEPTTVQVISQELETVENSVRQVLKRLNNRGRVEVDKSERPYTWSVVGDWTNPFVCDTCGYQSPTMLGIVKHEQSHE